MYKNMWALQCRVILDKLLLTLKKLPTRWSKQCKDLFRFIVKHYSAMLETIFTSL